MSGPTPHGENFCFIDSFNVSGDGKTVEALKFLPSSLPIFQDHFPGHPLMPGALLIECAAQASGVLWAEHLNLAKPPVFFLAQVLTFKLIREVLPDQTITILAALEREFGTLAQFSCQIEESQNVVASGRVVLSLQGFTPSD
jgi:3-hydroxyacyl-[acyl-carrier-protein] dehydratase